LKLIEFSIDYIIFQYYLFIKIPGSIKLKLIVNVNVLLYEEVTLDSNIL
jgi:hypothetical protein